MTIALDHSVYAPDDDIHVTVTNHLPAPVNIAWQITLNCLLIDIVRQDASSTDQGPYCFTTEANLGYRNESLTPGGVFTYTLDAVARDQYHVTLSPGTYQISTPWAVVTEHGAVTSSGTATSEPFRICACATCS